MMMMRTGIKNRQNRIRTYRIKLISIFHNTLIPVFAHSAATTSWINVIAVQRFTGKDNFHQDQPCLLIYPKPSDVDPVPCSRAATHYYLGRGRTNERRRRMDSDPIPARAQSFIRHSLNNATRSLIREIIEDENPTAQLGFRPHWLMNHHLTGRAMVPIWFHSSLSVDFDTTTATRRSARVMGEIIKNGKSSR